MNPVDELKRHAKHTSDIARTLLNTPPALRQQLIDRYFAHLDEVMKRLRHKPLPEGATEMIEDIMAGIKADVLKTYAVIRGDG